MWTPGCSHVLASLAPVESLALFTASRIPSSQEKQAACAGAAVNERETAGGGGMSFTVPSPSTKPAT